MTEDKSAEIVATCEAAVTWLTDPGKGWTRGKFRTSDRKACLAGAIALVVQGEDEVDRYGVSDEAMHCPAVEAVAVVIDERYPDRAVDRDDVANPSAPIRIFRFNDHDETEVQDVVDVLNETIKRHTSEVIAG